MKSAEENGAATGLLQGEVPVVIDISTPPDPDEPGLGLARVVAEGAEIVFDSGWEQERAEAKRIDAIVRAAPAMERVATYLREKGYEPLRVWRINGPKGAGGGELAGWLLQTLGKVVVAHQYPSGRYVIYERAGDI